MAYEVTATRRRPQAFDSLAGQEFVAETLKNSIQSQKIAHAYLFSGPRGCGKTSTARILAKALNCANGPTATPCGKCQQCIEITKGSSTDVIEIDGASNTSVNDVREIKDEVLFPPQSSKYKIYIIDEVHMLSNSAFNALLKTIEEPPPYVIFIFATTELQKVPATIKSRCQQFNFRLVPIETVKNLLAEAAKEIGIKADDEALYWIARESTGSVRDSYTLFDQVAAFSGDHITYDKIRDKLGLVGVDRLNAIFEDCAANDSNSAILKIDEFLQNGISIDQFIINCTDYLRSLLLIRTGITRESLLGQSVERYSQKVLAAWNNIQLERAMSIFMQLYRDVRYSLSPRYELELAFSRLSWLSQYVSPSEVKKAIDQAKALLEQGEKVLSEKPSQPVTQRQPQMLPQNQQRPAYANQFASAVQVTPQPQQQRNFFGTPSVPVNNASPEPEKPRQPVVNIFQKPSQNFFSGTQVSETPNVQVSETSVAPMPAQDDFYDMPDPTPPDALPTISQSFSDGGAVPPEQTTGYSDLKTNAVKELSISDPILASTLMQTGNWVKQGGKISTTIESSFQKNLLTANAAQISSFLSKLTGEQIQFVVSMKEKQAAPVYESLPPQINLLCSIFKGQVVGRSKKSDQEIQSAQQSEQEKKSSEDSDSDSETAESTSQSSYEDEE